MASRANIVIVGGGIVGSSIAYHLTHAGGAGEVIVIERDPTYEHAATPRSNGGVRRLFSLPENIQMSAYGLEFYRRFETDMALDDGEPANIGFRRQGYLFVSDDGGAAQMEENFRLQEEMGVEVELLTPAAVNARFPSISADGIDVAVLSDRDAWIDPHAALMGFRAKARELGVTYLTGEVKALEADTTAVRQARLSDDSTIDGDIFVNACGAWCAELGASVGLDIPVEPMSRENYFFRCGQTLEPLPLIKTETDLAFRPEGEGYTGGVPNWSEAAGWNFEINPGWFDEVVWPALARRLPAMAEIRLERSWRGHYARSGLDYSPIIGRWEGGLENLILANGFSGHGIMHAPATGRAVAELILEGGFRSIDISCFGYHRIREGKPYKEKGIV